MAYLNTDSATGTSWTIDYAERTGIDTWSVTTAAQARYAAFGHQPSLGFLPGTGEPAISYLYGVDTNAPTGSQTLEMRYVYRSEGSWFVEIVDNSSTVTGLFSDMAFDSNGRPAISYSDYSNGDLRIAFRLGTNDWQTEIVDSMGNVGRFNSLLFLPDGRPAIAYSDMTNGDLKYAEWDGLSAWNTQVVAQGLDGYYPSLMLDANGLPSIMFTDSDENVYLAIVVPEPSALMLLWLGMSSVFVCRFFHRRRWTPRTPISLMTRPVVMYRCALCVVVVFTFPCIAAATPVVDLNEHGNVVGVHNVNVNGTRYNVGLVYGSFESIFGLPGAFIERPTFWLDFTSGSMAANEIYTSLGALSPIPPYFSDDTITTDELFIPSVSRPPPYIPPIELFSAVVVWNNSLDAWAPGALTHHSHEQLMYANFTVVPEPSAVVLLVSGFIGASLWCKPRRASRC